MLVGRAVLAIALLGACDRILGLAAVTKTPDAAAIDAPPDAFIKPNPPCSRGYPSFPLATPGLTTVYGVAAADLDGDKKADLVLADTVGSAVVVMLAGPNGTFGAPHSYPVPNPPYTVAVGDIDGDGILDLISGNDAGAANGTISVLRGNGAGMFAAQTPYAIGVSPRYIAIADLNGDDRNDVVVSNLGSGSVSVLLGDVGGVLKPEVRYVTSPTAGSQPYGVVIADFDGDGTLDLATANFGEAKIAVLHGNGGGTFAAPVRYAAGTNALALVSGDLDGDGHPDLAVANFGGNNVGVFLNSGTGTFPAAQTPFAVALQPRALAIVDADGDGVLDLAVGDFGAGHGSLLRGTGGGAFAVSAPLQTVLSPSAMTQADFDGDGKLDLAIASRDDGTVHVALATPNGLALPYAIATGTTPMRHAHGDIDGDGVPDLVIPNESNNNVFSYLTRSGSLQSPSTLGAGLNPYAAALADLDGDGHLDLLVANHYYLAGVTPSTLHVQLGNGTGGFGAAMSYNVGYGPNGIATGDIDGDGKLDVVIADFGGNAVTIYTGVGDGTLVSQGSPPSGGVQPIDVGLVDVNADGILDLIVTNSATTPNGLAVRLGLGGGAFDTVTTYPTLGNNPYTFAVADFDRDGILDIAVANFGSSTVAMLKGNGDGTFTPRATYATAPAPWGIATIDLDGDGMLDVVTTSNNKAVAAVLLGNGDGSLRAPRLFPTAIGSTALGIADFDDDGAPDLVISNRDSNSGSLLLGRCL